MGVVNGRTGKLVIDGVHDGVAGAQTPTASERARYGCEHVVAFRPTLATRKPAVGDPAMLDGVAFRIAGLEKSPVSSGFELAYLAPEAN